MMPSNNTVLVIDDEPSLRASLSLILKRAGYNVLSASCLNQARTVLDGQHLDLIFLDLKLPDGTGEELLPKIRQQIPSPRVIIFSATPYNSLPFNPTAEGIDVYLEKPSEPEEILVAVHQLLDD